MIHIKNFMGMSNNYANFFLDTDTIGKCLKL